MTTPKKRRSKLRDTLKKIANAPVAGAKNLKKRRDALAKAIRAKIAKLTKEIKAAQQPSGPTVMYDDVDISLIPADAPAVAGYVNGRFITYPSLIARFPKAKHLSIAVTSMADAHCLDVEPGDATPDQAPAWVKRQHGRGVKRPVVYCSVSSMQGVIDLLERAGLKRSEFRVWTAHYTGRPHLCSSACGFGFHDHADATQWTDRAHGASLDESLLRPDFFG